MAKPKVIAMRSAKGTSDEVCVGRGTKWGNPFTHYPGGTLAQYRVDSRDESIDRYESWLYDQPELVDQLSELTGKTLVCWCKPARCHGDILLRLANPGLFDKPEPDPTLF